MGIGFKSAYTKIDNFMIQNFGTGRRLSDDFDQPKEKWWPVLGLSLGSSKTGDSYSAQNTREYNVLSLTSARWMHGKWEGYHEAVDKQPVGYHVRFEQSKQLNFGLLLENGDKDIKFAMEVAASNIPFL